MDATQILSALNDAQTAVEDFGKKYGEFLEGSSCWFLGEHFRLTPTRADLAQKGSTLNVHVALGHVLWMIPEAKKFITEGRTDKAMRWLCFIQGVLFCHGIASIDECIKANRAKAA